MIFFFCFLLFRWLVQAVHGKYFSRRKWDRFVKNRAVPGSNVGFAEIEVMLCDIPSKSELADDQKQLEQEEEGNHALIVRFLIFRFSFLFVCCALFSCFFFFLFGLFSFFSPSFSLSPINPLSCLFTD